MATRGRMGMDSASAMSSQGCPPRAPRAPRAATLLPEKKHDFPRLLRTQQAGDTCSMSTTPGRQLPEFLQQVLSWSTASGNRFPHQETLPRAHPFNTNKFLVVLCSFTVRCGKTFFVSLLPLGSGTPQKLLVANCPPLVSLVIFSNCQESAPTLPPTTQAIRDSVCTLIPFPNHPPTTCHNSSS